MQIDEVKMFEGLLHLNKISCSMIAETDDDAVGFYRKVGFSVQPLGNKYVAGINRYLCTLEINN